jgi:histidinol-phosphate aminotransferase
MNGADGKDDRPPSGTSASDVLRHVRPDIRALAGYTTGEQQPGFTKLNTNECAYPPSAAVRRVLAAVSNESLRLYPDPVSRYLRDVAAARYRTPADGIIAGNGSDDCLTILYRTFLRPGDRVACPSPSYGLYDTLAALQGAPLVRVNYQRDAGASSWGLPLDGLAGAGARLVVVANPNNPSSTLAPVGELRALADRLDGILVVDEAYVDFALPTNADASVLPHLAQHPNLVVLRTFSKSYSLAGARLGLLFAAPALVAEMNKVKDSYNVSAITQAIGAAALEDHAYHTEMVSRTVLERARLERELGAFGWSWPEARGNFLLCHVGPRARAMFEVLRHEKILVRYWDTPELRESIRITVGTRDQNDALLAVLRAAL